MKRTFFRAGFFLHGLFEQLNNNSQTITSTCHKILKLARGDDDHIIKLLIQLLKRILSVLKGRASIDQRL